MKTRLNPFLLAASFVVTAFCTPVLLPAQDTIPPVLIGITLQQDTVQNGDTLTMLLYAYDDLSGIDMIQIEITDDQGAISHSLYQHYEWYSGDDLYELQLPIGQWVFSGTSTITSVVIRDNEQNLFISGPQDLGTFYIQSDSPDSIPPEASMIMIAPDTVHVGETVTTTMTVTDGLSGFHFCNFTLMDNNDEAVQSYYGNFAADDTSFGGENILDVIGIDSYALDIEIPSNTFTGPHYFMITFYDHAGNYSDSNSETFHIVGDFTTGDQMIDPSSEPVVFPNPTTGTIRVSMNEGMNISINVFTPDGRLVHEQPLFHGSVIELAHLPNGPYLLLLRTPTGDHTYKIIRSEE